MNCPTFDGEKGALLDLDETQRAFTKYTQLGLSEVEGDVKLVIERGRACTEFDNVK
jgi:hypothetical protein